MLLKARDTYIRPLANNNRSVRASIIDMTSYDYRRKITVKDTGGRVKCTFLSTTIASLPMPRYSLDKLRGIEGFSQVKMSFPHFFSFYFPLFFSRRNLSLGAIPTLKLLILCHDLSPLTVTPAMSISRTHHVRLLLPSPFRPPGRAIDRLFPIFPLYIPLR